MLYDESAVKANLRNRGGKRVFVLGKADTLTPSARDFLSRERIAILSPEEIKRERLDRLMTLQADISLRRNQLRVGSVEKVLVTDVGEDGTALGRSHREAPETDGEILFTTRETPEIGSFVQVRLTEADTYDLKGEMV